MAGRLLTAKQVARLYGISVSQAYAMGQEGTLPTVRIGTSVRFPQDAIFEIAEHGVEVA